MSEIPPEVKAQLEEQKKNCIFCKIIKGEMESQKVYQDKELFGILDINPCVSGHVLLMPKEHYPIMPFLPQQTFKHMFGILPKIAGAIKKAMLSTGINVFIANGGIAGQQSPHFLIHLIPREKGDNINKFSFDKKGNIDSNKMQQVSMMLAKNLPLMIRNHMTKNPEKWFKGQLGNADFLKEIKEKEQTIYEDEKVLCVIPEKPVCLGHVVIYSNEEKENFEKLHFESSSHLFYTASFCATAVFEGLGAQGSNIILKSGLSDDNVDGRLCIHVLPRYENDGFDLICKPLGKKLDLKDIASRIKEETFLVEHSLKGEKKVKVIDLDSQIKIIDEDNSETVEEDDEIKKAIDRLTKK